ncbi:hypothetical protein DESPIG_01762 [Desulfovibrio piger ATCC 29098]|uniref:Uncharacterized protein n=1 Tax=Desulfovibrio piger ATCC 29098 TaxID=411464 RepID=B6WUL9_9BACT|nr:hypothetical protein DESPIG_01762 [Desulfovibrio piger ATCC 29098]
MQGQDEERSFLPSSPVTCREGRQGRGRRGRCFCGGGEALLPMRKGPPLPRAPTPLQTHVIRVDGGRRGMMAVPRCRSPGRKK